jgi:uncharacterized protein
VEGVVTAATRRWPFRGFWLQGLEPDGLVETSDAIFVATGSKPTVQAGQWVRVSGKVVEWALPKRWHSTLTVTTIRLADIKIVDPNRGLPEAVSLTLSDIPSTVPRRPLGEAFSRTASALDFWESLEGMRVSVPSVSVVGPSNRFGDAWVVDSGGAAMLSGRGALTAKKGVWQRLLIDWRLLSGKAPTLPVGARLTSPLVGVVNYAFGNYRIHLTERPTIVAAKSVQPQSLQRPPLHDGLSLATYNVQNLSLTDKSARFAPIALDIVQRLMSPDVLVLQEVQDDSGRRNDGVESAAETLKRLVGRIQTAGGPRYAVAQIDPQGGRDGGIPGGNIRTVMLLRAGRVMLAAPDPSVSAATCVEGQLSLPSNPYRFAQTDRSFFASRKPLIVSIEADGSRYLLIGLHLVSKWGDDALAGLVQPPVARSRVQRAKQARRVAQLVGAVTQCDSSMHIIVAGDLNDTSNSPALQSFSAVGLVDLSSSVPELERYSYIYQGRAELIDHIYVSQSLLAHQPMMQIVHINAEFPHVGRSSDHDPVVMWTRATR